MRGITYDTGVLIAAERGDRTVWSRHRGLLMVGVVPIVPAPVLAEAWRGGSRQAPLARLLAGCEVDPLTEGRARNVGELLGAAGHDDVVDGSVVEGAVRRADAILTSDRAHIQRLVGVSGQVLVVEIV